MRSTCDYDDCARAAYALGWCQPHYRRNLAARTDEHQRRQALSNYRPQQHGTRSRYRKGCRCDDCRRAETNYRRRYRQARR